MRPLPNRIITKVVKTNPNLKEKHSAVQTTSVERETFWTRNINPHSLSTDAVQPNEWFPAFPFPVSNFQHLQFFDFHIQVQIIFLNT